MDGHPPLSTNTRLVDLLLVCREIVRAWSLIVEVCAVLKLRLSIYFVALAMALP